MSKIITRRNILRGMFAAPAIIAIDNLMPVKAYAKLIKPDLAGYKVVCDLQQVPGAKSFYFESTIYYCPYIPMETEWFAPAALDKIRNAIIHKEPL